MSQGVMHPAFYNRRKLEAERKTVIFRPPKLPTRASKPKKPQQKQIPSASQSPRRKPWKRTFLKWNSWTRSKARSSVSRLPPSPSSLNFVRGMRA